ncbi:MAG: molybdopterin-dependent oxidoreductase, partial [Coriobacteriales bacterium]|nr:molybdopterin-dependent oxidoreductase [Coriobacteriales bacterium]
MTSQTGTNDDRSEFKYVGKFSPVGRQSYDMAKGVTKYSRDMTKEDMLCAKALKSPYAHAKVEIVDTSGAEALEGVALVLRWDDEDFQSYPAVPGSIPLLSDIANYEGDECGVVVVARTENICRKALDLIQVNWIVLPHIMDPRKAAAEGAPLMRPELNPESNIGGALFGDTNLFERGDVAQGFEEADHIIEYDVSWPNMEQFRPMPPAYLAYWEKAPYDNADYEDYLYVNGSSNSGDTGIKGFARQMMGIPRGRVRPTTFFSGGTYCNYSQQRGNFLTPYLSKRVGKPVRYPYGRRDEFFFCPPQNYHHGKIGFTDEGVITTAQMHLIYQQGVGYGQRLGYIFSTPTPDGGFSVTSVPNLWVRLEQVYTNGSLATTEPGPRTPDVSNVGFTRVAEVLGMDPIDVVLANIPENGQLSLRMCIEAGKKAFNWDEKYHAPGTRSLLDGRMHGAAILVAHQGHGSAGTRSNMNLALKHDGKVYLPYSDSIIGTYWPEMYQLVIAEETGMKPEDVIVHYSENYQNFDPCGSNEHATNGTYSA